MSIPLLSGEAAIRTLSLVAKQPAAFSGSDITNLSSIATFLGVLISSNSQLSYVLGDLLGPSAAKSQSDSAATLLAAVVLPEVAERQKVRDAIEDLLTTSAVRPVFQPIVDLSSRRAVAFEGLCRFGADPAMGPDQWIALGQQVGRGVQMESMALHALIAASGEIPEQYVLAVNLSPQALIDTKIQELLLGCRRHLVVELTEHEPAPEFLSAHVQPLRQHGIRLAVDDAGSGFAGLTTILRLRPDIIKLDRELTLGLDADPIRRALAAAQSHFAREIGASTVAEGIENERQLQLLRTLGFKYGQGFLLGRPQSVSDLKESMDSGPSVTADGRDVRTKNESGLHADPSLATRAAASETSDRGTV